MHATSLAVAAAAAAAGCAPRSTTQLAGCALGSSTDDSTFQLVRDRLAAAYRDMAAADLDRLMTLYLPDALIQGPAQAPIQGIEAIRAFWAATFQGFRLDLEPAVEEVTVFGDVFIVRGRASGTMVPHDGSAPVRVNSWFHQIYRCRPDGTLHFWRGANGPRAT
jgi:ketosteroid isomerase-like protein